MYQSASAGTIARFGRAVEAFTNSQIQQARNRSLSQMPCVNDFILMRRATIGAALVEGSMLFLSMFNKLLNFRLLSHG